ncbi:type II toxin-antitoxin system VapC family toxin [Fortiea sp. LEGE XX443]|uniref:PIN domain-containing protein n=1 Tax=Fortiea sp. LEGE XX443 TaxID=1828611 RepID=UPI0018810E36|nr:type II toxin-antitoxin system VapC family toxin [Fortiea sp. LEGE XX443]
MTEALCIDTSVMMKYLCPDEQTPEAIALITNALTQQTRLVAPCFAWAEVGSVLRKKLRINLLTFAEADQLYTAYISLPINYIDTEILRFDAWQLAEQYGIPTLYDAVFLACAKIESANFWTADEAMLNLFSPRPAYVYKLGD